MTTDPMAIGGRHDWNRTKPIDAPPVCVGCGGPHPFDTTIPSVIWNRVIRDGGLPDYLCITCIVRAFVLARESFTAELWSPELNGVPIEVRVRGAEATSAAAVSNENTALRARLRVAEAALVKSALPLEVLTMTCCSDQDTTLSPDLKLAVRVAVDALRAALQGGPP